MSKSSQALPHSITPLIETRFGLDGGAMFGIIPKPLWERTNPADEKNRIEMAARCLLVEYSDGKKVLVDSGLGGGWSEKEKKIYNIHDQNLQFVQHDGLTTHEITDVILTHLHFDHAGGIGAPDEAGIMRPVYANATHWVQRRNWSWAHAPSSRDGGSYRLEDFAFCDSAQGPELNLVDGIAEILPGIEVLPHHGHTFGMQLVKVTLESGQAVVFMADLIPTTSHLQDPYVMGYDLQPLVTVQEKRAFLHEAIRHDWILAFSHDPTCDFARVELDQRGRPSALPLSSIV